MAGKSNRVRLGVLVTILVAMSAVAGVQRARKFLFERSLQTAALPELIRLTKTDPGDARVYHFLAIRARASQMRRLALESYSNVAQLAPDDEADWLAWADTAVEVKGPIAGQAILLTYLKNHPGSFRVNVALARLYWSWDYASSVLKYATRATQLEPLSVDAWVLVGQADLKLAQYADAEKAFDQAIRADPRSWQALTGRGKTLRAEKKTAQAVESLEQAVSLTGREAEPRLELGKALLEAARTPVDLTKARQTLQDAMRLQSSASRQMLFDARLSLGQSYVAEADFKQARNWLEQAEEIEPGNSTVLFLLARVYEQLGDRARARLASQRHEEVALYQNRVKDLVARIGAAPNDADLRLKLARLYAAHGDYVDAGRAYQYLMSNNLDAPTAERELLALQATYLPRHP